jgi:hypothetical protein
MHVTVLNLLLCSSSYVRELDIKEEHLAGEWVVSVKGDVTLGKFDDTCWNLVPLRRYELNYESNCDILREVALSSWKGDYHLFISLAVSFSGSDLNLERCSYRLADECVLKPGHDLRVPM